MKLCTLCYYLGVATLSIAAPTSWQLSEIEFRAVGDCARLMAHYSSTVDPSVYTSQGCTINPRFTENKLKSILKSTNIKENEIRLSFKENIQILEFSVPKGWAEGGIQSPLQKRGVLNWLGSNHQPLEQTSHYFTTSDGKFLISSVTQAEFDHFNQGIMDYAEHLSKNPDSFLLRVIGMFSTKNMYFVAYVSPFSTRKSEKFVSFELPPKTVDDTRENQLLGYAPFGIEKWGFVNNNEACALSSEDGNNFLQTYRKDLMFLREGKYYNYQILVGIPLDESEDLAPWYNSFKNVNIRNNLKPISFSVSHFFSRGSKEEANAYAEKFDYFRKISVLYAEDEPRNIFKKKNNS